MLTRSFVHVWVWACQCVGVSLSVCVCSLCFMVHMKTYKICTWHVLLCTISFNVHAYKIFLSAPVSPPLLNLKMKSKLNWCFSFHPLSFGLSLCVSLHLRYPQSSPHLSADASSTSTSAAATAANAAAASLFFFRFFVSRDWTNVDVVSVYRRKFSVTAELLCANNILHEFSMHCSLYCVASLTLALRQCVFSNCVCVVI